VPSVGRNSGQNGYLSSRQAIERQVGVMETLQILRRMACAHQARTVHFHREPVMPSSISRATMKQLAMLFEDAANNYNADSFDKISVGMDKITHTMSLSWWDMSEDDFKDIEVELAEDAAYQSRGLSRGER
jgi:hypothetical protein